MMYLISVILALVSGTGLPNGMAGDAVADFALMAGLTPESVTVLGFNAASTQSALSRLDSEHALLSQLQAQMEAQHQLNRQIHALKAQARIQQDPGRISQLLQEIDVRSRQRDVLAAQIATRKAILMALFLGIQAENPSAPDVLDLQHGLPAEFRMLDLSDEEINTLRGALLAENRAEVEGNEPSLEVQQILASFRNRPPVQTALSNLYYNLNAVRAVFVD